MNDFFRICIMVLAGFAGGFAGSVAFHAAPLMAAEKGIEHQTLESVTILNSKGKHAGLLGYGAAGQGSLFMFNGEGKIIAQMGSYSNFRDKGQALIAIHDEKEALRGVFRTKGPYHSPTLIFRDLYGNERIVIGLEGRAEEPYLRFYDSNGRMVELSPKQF